MKHLYEEGFTQNRELSWLRYNERVLDEAGDTGNPVLERLNFISMFEHNLEEFYQTRVSGILEDQRSGSRSKDERSGLDPSALLARIAGLLRELFLKKADYYDDCRKALSACGVHVLRVSELTASEREEAVRWLKEQFRTFPVEINRSFSEIPVPDGGRLFGISRLRSDSGDYYGYYEVPEEIPAAYVFSEGTSEVRMVLLQDLMEREAGWLFAPFDVLEHTLMRIVRDARIAEDADLQMEDFKLELKERLQQSVHLAPVMLESERRVGREFLEAIRERFGLREEQVFFTGMPIGSEIYSGIRGACPKERYPKLYYPEHRPADRYPKAEGRILDRVRSQDIFLSYPYDSMEPFLSLLEEASVDPEVSEIRITIYRLASNPKIVEYLSAAAANGKKVRILIELRARSDESSNIAWAEKLEQAGCRISYGSESMTDYKVHCKLCQIVLGKGKHRKYITQFGTGNYNEKTAKSYADFCLMTYDQALGKDAGAFFNDVWENQFDEYRMLLASPETLRKGLYRLIKRETRKGEAGRIFMKFNSFTDSEMIDRLREASDAGVKVRLIVRGICCLLPGAMDCTENIEVVNVVGRFLEHSRVYLFGSGEDEVLYLSSADLMPRNLDKRVELACPVLDRNVRNEIKHILKLNYHDNVKGRTLGKDGRYSRKPQEKGALDSQKILAGEIH